MKRIILKKGAKVTIFNMQIRVADVINEKDIKFYNKELHRGSRYNLGIQHATRWYRYKEPYPMYNGESIVTIEWVVNDANETVLN